MLCCLSCHHAKQPEKETFDKTKWAIKVDADYPYRDKMLTNLMTYELHGIKQDSILKLLGTPDNVDTDYIFYNIAQERMSGFTLHTKTLVIKFKKDSTLEWRKIHQ